MSLAEWNPFRNVDSIARGMGSIFGGPMSPRVDVYQTENEVIMKAEIPGVSKDDLNVYVDENSIRISGQSKRHSDVKDEHVYRTERYFGSFSRTIPLPVEIKSDEAKAEYRDGILSIIAPKFEPSKTKGKKIDIE